MGRYQFVLFLFLHRKPLKSIKPFKDSFILHVLLLFPNLTYLFFRLYSRLVNPLSKHCQHKGSSNKKLRNGFVQWLILRRILFLLCIKLFLPKIIIRLLSQLFFFCLYFFLLLRCQIHIVVCTLFRQLFFIQLLKWIVNCGNFNKMIFRLLGRFLLEWIWMILFGQLSISRLDLLLGCWDFKIEQLELLRNPAKSIPAHTSKHYWPQWFL